MQVLIILISLSLVAFGLAFVLRNRQLSENTYDAISIFGAAVILGVVVFDFLPHLFADFPFFNSGGSHDHHHHHHDNHHDHGDMDFGWSKFASFSGLLLIGFFLQLGLENWVIKQQKHAWANWILVIGLFIHSFSEVALLHNQENVLQEKLFLGILFHKLPIAFILAYTLIKDFGVKKAVIGFSLFMLAVPLGLLFNNLMINTGDLFTIASVLITGMIMHVLWHMLEAIKSGKLLSWAMLILGLIVGYTVTLFH